MPKERNSAESLASVCASVDFGIMHDDFAMFGRSQRATHAEGKY